MAGVYVWINWQSNHIAGGFRTETPFRVLGPVIFTRWPAKAWVMVACMMHKWLWAQFFQVNVEVGEGAEMRFVLVGAWIRSWSARPHAWKVQARFWIGQSDSRLTVLGLQSLLAVGRLSDKSPRHACASSSFASLKQLCLLFPSWQLHSIWHVLRASIAHLLSRLKQTRSLH